MLLGIRSQYEAQAGGTDGTATPTGVAATGAIGSVTMAGTASSPVTGVAGTGAVGTAILTGFSLVVLSGVEGTSAIGTVAANGFALVLVTGVNANGYVGDEEIYASSAAAYYKRYTKTCRGGRGRR